MCTFNLFQHKLCATRTVVVHTGIRRGGGGGQQAKDHLQGLGVDGEIMLTGWEAVDWVIGLRTGTSVGPL